MGGISSEDTFIFPFDNIKLVTASLGVAEVVGVIAILGVLLRVSSFNPALVSLSPRRRPFILSGVMERALVATGVDDRLLSTLSPPTQFLRNMNDILLLLILPGFSRELSILILDALDELRFCFWT